MKLTKPLHRDRNHTALSHRCNIFATARAKKTEPKTKTAPIENDRRGHRFMRMEKWSARWIAGA
jgi:hypothetical protein